MAAGYFSWKSQLPTEPEQVQPIFSDLFKDCEDNIIPWSGTDPDTNVNCFTWNIELTDWICALEAFDLSAPIWQGPVHLGNIDLAL